MNLHQEIMKIPANGFKLSPKYYGEYETVCKLGHRNALSEASKLSLETEKKLNKAIELLLATVNPFDKRTNQQRHEEILKFLEDNK